MDARRWMLSEECCNISAFPSGHLKTHSSSKKQGWLLLLTLTIKAAVCGPPWNHFRHTAAIPGLPVGCAVHTGYQRKMEYLGCRNTESVGMCCHVRVLPWSSIAQWECSLCMEAVVHPWLNVMHSAVLQILMFSKASEAKQKSAQRIQMKTNNRKTFLSHCFQRPAGSQAGEGLSEMQGKEMWKAMNEEGSNCSDSWELVCAVR